MNCHSMRSISCSLEVVKCLMSLHNCADRAATLVCDPSHFSASSCGAAAEAATALVAVSLVGYVGWLAANTESLVCACGVAEGCGRFAAEAVAGPGCSVVVFGVGVVHGSGNVLEDAATGA